MFGPDMAPSNFFHTRTTREGHCDFKLIHEHFKDLSDSIFSFRRKSIKNWPSNLHHTYSTYEGVLLEYIVNKKGQYRKDVSSEVP